MVSSEKTKLERQMFIFWGLMLAFQRQILGLLAFEPTILKNCNGCMSIP